MRAYLGCLALIVSASMALAQDSGRLKTAAKVWNTVELLGSNITDVTFENQPLDQIIDWLKGEFPGLNIQVRWTILEAVPIQRNKEISVNLKNVRLDQVLWMIMNEASGGETQLAYRASGNLIILSTAEDLGKEQIVRVYDVTDLILRVPNFRDAPRIDIQQAGQGGGGQGGTTNIFGGGQGQGQDDENDRQQDQPGQVDPEMQRLIDLITNTIDPESWQVNNGRGSIAAFRRQLVVRNNIGVHQKLGGAIEEGK